MPVSTRNAALLCPPSRDRQRQRRRAAVELAPTSSALQSLYADLFCLDFWRLTLRDVHRENAILALAADRVCIHVLR